MTLLDASTWKAYWVSESTPGTTPTNPAFTFLGAVTSGKPTPNTNYKQIRASGSKDYYINQLMSVRPTISLSVVLANVSALTTLVSSDQAHSLVLRDSTNSLYVRMLGNYIDRCRLTCDVEDNLMADLDCVAMSTDNTAPTLGSGSYGADTTTALFYQDVTVLKDASPLTDWTRVSFEVSKDFLRRFTPSTGATRTLSTVARTHTLSLTRDMDTTDAFNEYVDHRDGTSRTMKLKVQNQGAGAIWSVQLNTAKTTNFDADILSPEDLIGKDLEYIGTTLTFGTS